MTTVWRLLFYLGYICKPDFLQHLGSRFGVGNACPETALDRVSNILLVIKHAAREMVCEGHRPFLVIDNIGALFNRVEGENILEVLQDFAKEAADNRMLTILFASSDGHVPNFFLQRSSSSRLQMLYMDDIHIDDAIEYLKCSVPQSSVETFEKAVDLVGGRFADLIKVTVGLNYGSGLDELQDNLFANADNELQRSIGVQVNLYGNITHDLAILTMQIARSILDSKDKQITIGELNELLKPFNTEQNQDGINRLLSSNIFMERKRCIKFESTLMQSYFEYIFKHSEDQTEE